MSEQVGSLLADVNPSEVTMSPEQLAEATLKVQTLQTWITGVAIVLGPLCGVAFTLWTQKRKERSDAKHRLFLDLMGERNAPFVSATKAQALNKIDVVFSDCAGVRQKWHEYFQLLHGDHTQARAHKWLELLSAMAASLGYQNLSQVDIDKFYLPQGHIDDAEFQRKVAQQWARVLENTEHFVVKARENEPHPNTPTNAMHTGKQTQ